MRKKAAVGKFFSVVMTITLWLGIAPCNVIASTEGNEFPKKDKTERRFLSPAFFAERFSRAMAPFHETTRRYLRLLPADRYLPQHLQGRKHWDYPPLTRWVPRSVTTFDWGQPAMLLGNQQHYAYGSPKPIGQPGSFQISRYPDLPFPINWLPLYIAWTTPKGTHIRFGARWDDVDMYITMPSVAIKKLKKPPVDQPSDQ